MTRMNEKKQKRRCLEKGLDIISRTKEEKRLTLRL
jgi:hypothetical protein